MFNTNTLNAISYAALIVTLLVMLVLLWELWKRRIILIRVERAKHPRWYWLCIVAHAVVVAFMVLFCGALALTSLFNDFFN
jgi:hypothetical protein